MSPHELLDDDAYRRLFAFRSGLRRFLRWSEEQAAEAGLTPAQHQLLLAVRAFADPGGPAIGDVAEALLLRHNSAVELVDRVVSGGLVTRAKDDRDHRVMRLRLTPAGERVLARLAARHVEELDRLAPQFARLWRGLAPAG